MAGEEFGRPYLLLALVPFCFIRRRAISARRWIVELQAVYLCLVFLAMAALSLLDKMRFFDGLLHLRHFLIGEHGEVVFPFGGGEHSFVLDGQTDEEVNEAVGHIHNGLERRLGQMITAEAGSLHHHSNPWLARNRHLGQIHGRCAGGQRLEQYRRQQPWQDGRFDGELYRQEVGLE